MAGTEGMAGAGKVTPDRVSEIVDNYRSDAMTDSEQTNLKEQLGTKLQPHFDLDEGEVKMLNQLPPETLDTLFHICTRAASSGGKIEYTREDAKDGRPRMEIGYSEHVDHKPDGGGGPNTVGNAKIVCLK